MNMVASESSLFVGRYASTPAMRLAVLLQSMISASECKFTTYATICDCLCVLGQSVSSEVMTSLRGCSWSGLRSDFKELHLHSRSMSNTAQILSS